MQKISMEDGLAACRVRLGELTYDNVLLHATITALEAELARLRGAAPPADGMLPETHASLTVPADGASS